jgi:hypothetical protein
MAELLDIKKEVQELKKLYDERPRKGNFTALLLGESGSGKTWVTRTARLPIHYDMFDPGGDTNLDDLIANGKAIVDMRWTEENPKKPSVFKDWEKVTEERFKSGYFNQFGTIVLDSATTWSEAIMNQVLKDAGIPGDAPRWAHDYVPQKVKITNWIKRFMSEPISCDFFLTGHLEGIKDEVTGRMSYRFMTTGKAQVTIPLLFDEIYVLDPKGGQKDVEYRILTKATGTHLARSRMAKEGYLNTYEEANIKQLLKKCKRTITDKPLLF